MQTKKRRKHSGLSRLKIWVRTALTTYGARYGSDRLAAFKAGLKGEMPDPAIAEDVVLVACDDLYFQKFGLSLIASMGTSQDALALHVHLLRPSDATVAQAAALKAANPKFSFTTDDCHNRHPANGIEIYYTAARFILAPLLLEAGVKRLLIIDIDSVLNRSPWPIIDMMPAATSVGLVFRHEMRRDWQKVLANAVLYKGDDAGKLFAGRFARALLMNLTHAQEYHIDQIIPYYLVKGSNASLTARIQSLPTTINSLEYAEEAAFWTAKGEDKHSEKFANVRTLKAS